MFLTELFDTVPKFETLVDNEEQLRLQTKIGNESIIFVAQYERLHVPIRDFTRLSVDGYEIVFKTYNDLSGAGPDYHTTNSGNAFKVFPFVLHGFKLALANAAKYAMPAFHFSAYRNENSRVTLYRRMMKMLPSNYETFEKQRSTDIHFYIIDGNYLKHSLKHAPAAKLAADNSAPLKPTHPPEVSS